MAKKATRKATRRSQETEKTVPLTMRMDKEVLEHYKSKAEKIGVGTQTMIKMDLRKTMLKDQGKI